MKSLRIALATFVVAALASCGAAAQEAPGHPGPRSLSSGFEQGLRGFNLAGVGEVDPRVTAGAARTGSHAGRFELRDGEDRSELILGGDGGGSNWGQVEFHDGDEYWYGFSFLIRRMVWGHPGAHNLILQLFSETSGPQFGLQLWAVDGEKGLWTHGPAMDGDRFLSRLALRRWHDVQIHLRTSDDGDGFYRIFLDGSPVDGRSGVSTIHPGDPFSYLKTGLYRNGGTIPGRSTVLLDAVKLGSTRASVLPE